MNQPVSYTPYHPRWHRTHVSTWWWMQRWSYFMFIVRELTSLAVAWFVIYLLVLVARLGQGAAAYAQFLEWSRTPLVLTLNVASLALVLLHAVTWFNLAPQAMVLHLGARRVPGALVAASNYAGLAAVSAVILGLLLIG